PNTKCPAGMGVGMLTELMMRFWPKSCCSYNKLLIHDALVTLGMAEGDFVWPKTPSIYQDFMGKCATILRKMEQMKLPRRPEPGNDEPPDYITVNEFLWFVHDYKDLIKETIMKKQLKPVNSKEKIKKGTRKLEDAFKDDEMLKRLAAALRTKPFVILAGHSGTGKSRLVRRLAYMTCNNELLIAEGAGKAAPGNYCMVQVKPNWHDSTDLLGYYSEMDGRHFVNTPFVQFICKAYAYPDTPFFVCLDEMNLAPVEQYFAEYLSAVESMEEKDGVWVTDPLVEIDKTGEKDADGREKMDVAILEQIMKGAASTEAAEWIQKHGLTIPKNLFVVGTVNVDETTSQFPRKVLDRAMTLLMNEVRFADMAKSKSPSEEELLDETGLKFFLERDDRKVGERESKLLDGINAPLSNTPFMVAYRFGNEYALYEAALAKLDGVDLASADEPKQDEIARRALDHVVMMKLLPRIHGEKVEVKNIFSGYDRKKEGGAAEHVDGLKNKLPSDGLSVAMMDKILARDDEYLIFWP
ncbi:MAG: AAA family ATPase, partial [Kiritimatiellae bacterium]|nr:AAA family ATPase [Kiritimatiellia bacterium]